MNNDQADAFMASLTETLKALDAPACIVMSYGENKFYVENEMMSDLEAKEKDVAFTGMNIALMNGLLNVSYE